MAISNQITDIPGLTRVLFPAARLERIQGDDYLRCSDPNGNRAGANDGSFTIRLSDGRWTDWNGADRGDLVDIIIQRGYANDHSGAAAWLRNNGWLNGTASGPTDQPLPDRQPPPLQPYQAAPPAGPAGEFLLGYAAYKGWQLNPDQRGVIYRYQQPDGALVCCAVRFNLLGGGKEVRVCRWDGRAWCWQTSGYGPAPLYNAPALAANPGRPALVVEGEKAADAARRHPAFADYIATCPLGGSNYRPTDWALLAGRQVYILPDNDPAGETFALKVADECRRSPAVAIIHPARVWRKLGGQGQPPKGWDVADPVDTTPACVDCGGHALPPGHSADLPFRCLECCQRILDGLGVAA